MIAFAELESQEKLTDRVWLEIDCIYLYHVPKWIKRESWHVVNIEY